METECATSHTSASPGPASWLNWMMRVLDTNRQLLAERHPNPWFTLFLALCLPSLTAGMMLCVCGWSTGWHPIWAFPITVYSLNVIWSPLLLRYSEEVITTRLLTKLWCRGIMSITVFYLIIISTVACMVNKYRAWLPFGDIGAYVLTQYFQVPLCIMTEHALFVHGTRPTGSAAAVTIAYFIIGTRLEEARTDVVFGARLLASARSGQCPYRGGQHCLPHVLIAAAIIVASAVDYATEAIEVHALSDIAPHLPLRVKQFRANILKIACEVFTLAAILFILFSGMAEYRPVEAGRPLEPPTLQQAEMRRYALLCLCATMLAVGHVLLMMLVPEAAWVRVQMRAGAAVRSAARRLSTAAGYHPHRGQRASAVVPCMVAPGERDAEAKAALGIVAAPGEHVDIVSRRPSEDTSCTAVALSATAP